MIGARQRIGHMTVVGHPTNLDVWSVTIHSVLLVLQPANHNAGIRPCGSWGNNNIQLMVAISPNIGIAKAERYCWARGS